MLVKRFHGCIVCTVDQLTATKPTDMATRTVNIPAVSRRRTHRGCRGGTKRWVRRVESSKQRLISFLSVFIWNVSLVGSQRELSTRVVLCVSQRLCYSEDTPVPIATIDSVRTEKEYLVVPLLGMFKGFLSLNLSSLRILLQTLLSSTDAKTDLFKNSFNWLLISAI